MGLEEGKKEGGFRGEGYLLFSLLPFFPLSPSSPLFASATQARGDPVMMMKEAKVHCTSTTANYIK